MDPVVVFTHLHVNILPCQIAHSLIKVSLLFGDPERRGFYWRDTEEESQQRVGEEGMLVSQLRHTDGRHAAVQTLIEINDMHAQEIAAYLITFEKHEEWLTTSPKTSLPTGDYSIEHRTSSNFIAFSPFTLTRTVTERQQGRDQS
ncbi:hypothetical protein PAMA_021460 [Pampus argenteus]